VWEHGQGGPIEESAPTRKAKGRKPRK
jgi:hypothetical protein